MTPLVSLIITCYNFEQYIGLAISSLLNLKGNYDYEIIVIDDGSRDNSDSIIRQFTDPKINYVKNEKNIGAAACINLGFEIAKGKYIARLDGDDVWEESFLTDTIPIFEKFQDVGLIYGDFNIIDKNGVLGKERNNIKRENDKVKGNEFKNIIKKYDICAPAIIGRREAWELGLPWSERFKSGLGDWFMVLLIAEMWNFYFVDKILASYRVHNLSMHHTFISDKSGEINTEYILNYFELKNNSHFSKSEWNSIYSDHYINLANSYFGQNMLLDARRCYAKSLKRKPSNLTNIKLLQLFLGTYLKKETYEKIKGLLR